MTVSPQANSSKDDNYITINPDVLEKFAADLLIAGGYGEDESRVTAESLILSNLLGYDSHGVIRVLVYLYFLKNGDTAPNAGLSILRENDSMCWVDGHSALGQVVMPQFLDILYGKIEKSGVVSGAIRNCGHIGRLGEWAEKIARKGYAGFIAVNDNGHYENIAPPGGKSTCTSTNPIAFGIPVSDDEPYVLDISTSASSFGKINVCYQAGEDCPPDLIQDADGNMTTDSSALFKDPKGAIMPMGGAQAFKGFGISMFVDFLVAGLTGGFTPPAPADSPQINSVVVTMWDPNAFAGLDHMQEQAQKYREHVRNVTPIDPDKPVRIPGERSQKVKVQREKDGIPVSLGTWGKLTQKAEELGVAVPTEFI